MMVQVIVNERGDKEVAVVIAPMHTQVQVMMKLLTHIGQGIRIQLAVQKLIGRTLVHQ